MKKITILFAALAALVSCNKENPVTPETPSQETYSFSLTAVAPNHGGDTKTTLVGDGNDKLVHWTEGDAIKLLFFAHGAKNYVKYTSQGQVLTSVSTEPTAEETKFRIENWPTSGKNIIDDRDYFKDMGIAVYPSSATAYSEKYYAEMGDYYTRSEVSFVLPEEQVAVYEDCGWEYVWGHGFIHIFRAPADSDTEEFYLDPAQQATTLKKLRKDIFFRARWIPFYLFFFNSFY